MTNEYAVKTRSNTFTGLSAALLCILGPMSLPIGPVPISLTNLVLYFMLYILGWKRATTSYVIYLLLGLVGLPVFSGYIGGLAKLAGPTGGYLIGFIPMAIISGLVIQRSQRCIVQIIAMIFGTLVCYAFGTVWYCIQAGVTFWAALSVCVIPFLPGDFIKIIAASLVGPNIRKRIKDAGVL